MLLVPAPRFLGQNSLVFLTCQLPGPRCLPGQGQESTNNVTKPKERYPDHVIDGFIYIYILINIYVVMNQSDQSGMPDTNLSNLRLRPQGSIPYPRIPATPPTLPMGLVQKSRSHLTPLQPPHPKRALDCQSQTGRGLRSKLGTLSGPSSRPGPRRSSRPQRPHRWRGRKACGGLLNVVPS